MTNYEKYKDLVISCILQDSMCELSHVAYGYNECSERSCKECREFTAEWIKREYNEIDWAKVPVDTPVLIKKGNDIVNRYFARYYNRMVEVYANGQTSWSTDGGVMPWEPKYVMLANTGDIEKYAKQ